MPGRPSGDDERGPKVPVRVALARVVEEGELGPDTRRHMGILEKYIGGDLAAVEKAFAALLDNGAMEQEQHDDWLHLVTMFNGDQDVVVEECLDEWRRVFVAHEVIDPASSDGSRKISLYDLIERITTDVVQTEDVEKILQAERERVADVVANTGVRPSRRRRS